MGPDALAEPTPDGFRGLVLEELNSVYRLAYHLAGSRDEAEDLVQETYLRAFKSRVSYRTTEHGVRPWLFKILHNTYKTRLGRRHREMLSSELLDNLPAAGPGAPPIDSINWDMVDERLKSAVESLPSDYRAVLLMWAVEGMKYREIAEVIDAPIGTVMSRLHRARQAVIDHVGDGLSDRAPARAPEKV